MHPESVSPASNPLDPILAARHEDFIANRPPGAEEDVHMLPKVVDHIIQRCSHPGDLILDPFAGYGTTLSRAVVHDRSAIGVELLPERAAYLARHIPAAHIIQGDAKQITQLVQANSTVPHSAQSVQLIVTSPPYMTTNHHAADPLTGYLTDDGDYARYLTQLGEIAAQCARLLVPGGYLVWNVADIAYRGHTTQLIADCARVLAQHLTLAGITEIVWDRYPHDLIKDALLVFSPPTP